jgi:tripartite-type tricarboxylate transporter receptor subunit TctC
MALSTLGAFAGRAGAQGAQPLENVRIVTGFPPGGTSDTLCRRVAEGIKGSAYTKQAIVENKPGAGGQIAVQAMKGAVTDGSVLLQTPASMLMIYPHIYKSLPYNAFTDVTAVSLACTFDFGFCVGPAVPDTSRASWCGPRQTRTRRITALPQPARFPISLACCSVRPATSS